MKKLEQLDYEEHVLVPPLGHGAGGLALLWKKEINDSVLSASANCIDTSITFEGKFSILPLSMEILT